MSYKRPQRHRVDNNQSDLVKLFISLGGLWIPRANKPFDGWAWHPSWRRAVLDPVCGYMPVEIKNPKKDGHADEYTAGQRKTMRVLRIAGATWLVWRTELDVYACVGARRADDR